MNGSRTRGHTPRAGALRVQRGIGLVEILVAVLVISLGFTAAAQMQVSSMRSSQNAYYRSQAYFMANAMIDRMRANVEGVRQGRYDDVETSKTAPDPGCADKDCSPEEIAQQDLHDWSARLHANTPTLPSTKSVTAMAEIQSGAGGRYTIRVVWGEVLGGEEKSEVLTVDFVAER